MKVLLGVVGTALHPDHRADLKKSRLSDETIYRAGIESIRPQDIPRVLGQNPKEVTSAYRIPYPGTDFYRCKVFPPFKDRHGHTIKYLQLSVPPRLYIPIGVETLLPDPSIPLAVVEGEKKTLRLVQEGHPAVGIGGVWNWCTQGGPLPDFDRIAFVNREVFIYFDSDVWVKPQLREAAYALGKELECRGAEVQVAVLTPDHEGQRRGVDDYEHITVERGNKIKGLGYISLKHRVFTAAAHWWKGWKVRQEKEKEDPGGQPLFPRDEPWPHPVDGATLLDAVRAKITTHVALPDGAADAITLWIVHTFAIDAIWCTPILAPTSATKREGKSTLMDVVANLSRSPLPTVNISPAALYRAIEAFSPSLFLDEADKIFTMNEDLRMICNAGHTRASAYVWRTAGDDHIPTRFSVFGPKAISLIGRLPETMMDRSIEIRLKRKRRGATVERLNRKRLAVECQPLREQIVRWWADQHGGYDEDAPTLPVQLDDRAQDNWRCLFALATLAGGDWPERARQASLILSEARGKYVEYGEELLADLRDIFGAQDRLWTVDILSKLNDMADRPWPTIKDGKYPLNANILGRMLREFEIKSKDIRMDGKNLKGYQKAGAMAEAFDRYLPPPSMRYKRYKCGKSRG